MGLAAHTKAEKLRRQQSNAVKAKQVYLNTLAVSAVQSYLEWRGFDTDWENSDSYHPMMVNLMNVADLILTNIGKVECYFVEKGVETVTLPNREASPEAMDFWEDRIAFIFVEFSESLREAMLLGFAEKVSKVEEISLSELRSLDELVGYLSQFEEVPVKPQIVQLSRWLNDVIDAGWESLETLFNYSQNQTAFNFRWQGNSSIERGKVLRLEQAGQQVVLLVRLTPSKEAEIDISVEVKPAVNSINLLPNMQLLILDETGEAVMQAEAENSESLEFQFSGFPGEKFSVQIKLGELRLTEMFAI
ncbi:DUF1822 family protein [Ancylothrix sp. C2]|uniref:DUF1822 family protein n=1 Tax=Ancylothrix sp. D3o TaxID=2953691 RepID=UPI0021BB3A5F|nr:DUF1822 family protein [Ancylothrix sp. D3o]MCT7952934.1 DUF1822 family protein [Ancylothrix sp. D3o]